MIQTQGFLLFNFIYSNRNLVSLPRDNGVPESVLPAKAGVTVGYRILHSPSCGKNAMSHLATKKLSPSSSLYKY